MFFSIANFACFNLSPSITAKTLLNPSIVKYLSCSGIFFSILSVFFVAVSFFLTKSLISVASISLTF